MRCCVVCFVVVFDDLFFSKLCLFKFLIRRCLCALCYRLVLGVRGSCHCKWSFGHLEIGKIGSMACGEQTCNVREQNKTHKKEEEEEKNVVWARISNLQFAF